MTEIEKIREIKEQFEALKQRYDELAVEISLLEEERDNFENEKSLLKSESVFDECIEKIDVFNYRRRKNNRIIKFIINVLSFLLFEMIVLILCSIIISSPIIGILSILNLFINISSSLVLTVSMVTITLILVLAFIILPNTKVVDEINDKIISVIDRVTNSKFDNNIYNMEKLNEIDALKGKIDSDRKKRDIIDGRLQEIANNIINKKTESENIKNQLYDLIMKNYNQLYGLMTKEYNQVVELEDEQTFNIEDAEKQILRQKKL